MVGTRGTPGSLNVKSTLIVKEQVGTLEVFVQSVTHTHTCVPVL